VTPTTYATTPLSDTHHSFDSGVFIVVDPFRGSREIRILYLRECEPVSRLIYS